MDRFSPIILFGGTFDPVHYGHLRLAEKLHNLLPDAEIRMMPSATPPHREEPGATAQQRLAMLVLATDSFAQLTLDDRELKRRGPSYTLLSIQEIQREYPERSLMLVMGDDAMTQFDSWYQWQQIVQQVNLLVVARPGAPVDPIPEQVLDHITLCDSIEELAEEPSGGLYRHLCPLLDISASQIRQLTAEKRSSRFLLPDSVIEYIQQNHLYTRV